MKEPLTAETVTVLIGTGIVMLIILCVFAYVESDTLRRVFRRKLTAEEARRKAQKGEAKRKKRIDKKEFDWIMKEIAEQADDGLNYAWVGILSDANKAKLEDLGYEVTRTNNYGYEARWE